VLQRNDEVEFVRTHQKRGFARRFHAYFRAAEKLVSVILSWHSIRRDKRLLMGMTDEHLKDIGLSRSMIDHVSNSRPYGHGPRRGNDETAFWDRNSLR
jgi:uncharacterized protein YjiS (DUF1127 family)